MKNNPLILLAPVLILLSACADPTYQALQKKLAQAHYIATIPPEVGINPGEVYNTKEETLSLLAPSGVVAITGSNADFFSVANHSYTLSASAGASFAKSTISSSAPLSAALSGSYAKSVSVDLGNTYIREIPTDNLQETDFLSTLPRDYANRINTIIQQLPKSDPPRNVVVAVLESTGMKITVNTTDSASASAIANIVNTTTSGSATIQGSGSNSVVLSPDSNKTYVIGVKYLNKDDIWPQ
jgi:hypothetical protein